MNSTVFEELIQSRNLIDELHKLFTDGGYDLDALRQAAGNRSVNSLHFTSLALIEVLLSLKPNDTSDHSARFLEFRLAELNTAVLAFKSHAQTLIKGIRAQWKEGVSLRDGNNNFSLQFFVNNANTANYEAAQPFQNLTNAVNQLFAISAALLPLCKPESIGDLTARAEALANIAREAGQIKDDAAKQAKAAKASADTAAKHLEVIQGQKGQAEATIARIDDIHKKASGDLGSVTALVEKIKTVGSDANSLERQVSAYGSTLDAFQKQLDDRNTRFAKFEDDTKVAQEKNSAREREIDRLMKLANAMISGATTAGLADSLEKTRLRYETRMNRATLGFWISVIFLIASAFPLAAHLLPGVAGDLFPKIDATAENAWYGILGKVLLLVPATWLAAYYTKKYAEYFTLEREYAHKAALAMSVDGFKLQAPEYAEEITAEVFIEIRNNPANRPTADQAAHPLYDVLSKVVRGVLDRKKGDPQQSKE